MRCHQEGGSSFQCNNGQFEDQVCQTPHLRGVCPAVATEGGAKLLKEERNLSKEGLEDEEERDSHAPEGLPFKKKQCCSFLMYSAVTFTFSAMLLVLI